MEKQLTILLLYHTQKRRKTHHGAHTMVPLMEDFCGSGMLSSNHWQGLAFFTSSA